MNGSRKIQLLIIDHIQATAGLCLQEICILTHEFWLQDEKKFSARNLQFSFSTFR